MVPPTEREVRSLAGKTGYRGQPLERMIRLLDILQAIEHDRLLGRRLALKGGTALNAFHLGLRRLSVDIDLDYIGALDESAMLAERNAVDSAMFRILGNQEYRVKSWKQGSGGSKWDLRFTSALGGDGTLKVDLGYVDRQPLFGASRMSSVEIGGRKASDILVLDREDVIVGKLRALFQRTLARDLFDAVSIGEIADELDRESVKAAFLAFIAASRGEWRDLSIRAGEADPYSACRGLLICLPVHHFRGEDDVVAWYNKAVHACRERFGWLLEVDHQETLFLDGVQTRGEVDASLLNAPPEIRARIDTSPGIARKCQRVLEGRESQAFSGPRRPSGPSIGL